MTALWTEKTAAMATNGTAIHMWDIHGLSIDTRTLKPGDLFVPLKDIRDGHDFIPMAYEKGAAAVITEHAVDDVPALVVADALGALQGLAIAARTRSNAKRIAVTGSVGKTSVKEMLAVIFRASGKTHASVKSFNNHWGVPLTLASMPQDTEYGVFEMGMNHAGELRDLSQIVRPHIAIITKVSGAHLQHFAGVEDIAKAKSEILTAVETDGFAILPRDNKYYNLLAQTAKSNGVQIKSFGTHVDADARIIREKLSQSGSDIVLNVMGEKISFHLPLPGRHWVENAACVMLCAKLSDIDLKLAVEALKDMEKLQGRGETKAVIVDGRTVRIIDESYNANPESMQAAIALLSLNAGRKIAVLGDMLELGPDELALHSDLSDALIKSGVDQVLCCGSRMRALDEALPKSMKAGWFETAEDCLIGLKDILQPNDTIMIKGSNASGMGRLVLALSTDHKNRDYAHVL